MFWEGHPRLMSPPPHSLQPTTPTAGDFPDVDRYREILSAFDLSRFPKLDKAMVRQVRITRLAS